MVVRNAQRDLMDGTWYLEAINEEGTNTYDFSFAPYARLPEPLDDKPGMDDEGENTSMSGGTIAGKIRIQFTKYELFKSISLQSSSLSFFSLLLELV